MIWNINIQTSVDEADRRALGIFLGKKGMASLAECRRFIYRNGMEALTALDDPKGDANVSR